MTDVNKTYGAPADLDLSNCSASGDGGKTRLKLSEIAEQITNNADLSNKIDEVSQDVENLKNNPVDLKNVVKTDDAFKPNGYSKLSVTGEVLSGLPAIGSSDTHTYFGYKLDDVGNAIPNPAVTGHRIEYFTKSGANGNEQSSTDIIWNDHYADSFASRSIIAKAYHPDGGIQCSLGLIGNPWSDIFSKKALTVISDINTKTIVTLAENIPNVLFENINAYYFKLNSDIESKGDDASIHTGFIAQDVEECLKKAGVDPHDMEMWVSASNETISSQRDENGNFQQVTYKIIDKEGVDTIQSLRYEEVLVALFQGAKNKIISLEKRLEELEAKIKV